MSTLTRIIFLLFFLTCLIVPSSAWLAGYTYRQGHYINGSDSGLQTNYQIMINVSNTVGSSSGNLMYLNAHSVVFPDDLRFTDTSDTAWDYWVESNNTTYATIWIEVPSIQSGSTSQVEMYAYYGKAGGTSASNGTLTFPFFDHFEGSSVNTTKWTAVNNVSVSGSVVDMIGDPDVSQLYGNTDYGVNYSFIARIKTDHFGAFCITYYEYGGLWSGLGDCLFGLYADRWSSGGKYKTSSGADTTYSSMGGWSAGVWHRQEIIRHVSNVTYYQDYTDAVDVTVGYFTTAKPWFFQVLELDSKISVDWALVRVYVDPEPAHSTYVTECTPPVAAFTANATSGYPPFDVQFTDTSTGTPTTWDWYFPNGGDAHATPATWTFDYNIGNSATSYDIELNVSNTCGSDWENKTSYITAYPLEAHFSANTTSGSSPLCVQFTDATTNGTPINWSWDFGDGNTSFDHNPTHCYSGVGLYTVRLNASNLYSWDWLNETNYINVSAAPTPTPTPTPTATVGNATIYPSTYLSEETAVPFELFILLIILGVVFLGLGIALASPMHIVVVSLMGMMFLAAAAFVAPVVGFFNYEAFQITNSTTGNVSMTFIPSVSLVAQPWVSWLLWGMFLVGLINLGVRGVGGWWMEAGQKRDEWER